MLKGGLQIFNFNFVSSIITLVIVIIHWFNEFFQIINKRFYKINYMEVKFNFLN
jgi:hypothetical protein